MAVENHDPILSVPPVTTVSTTDTVAATTGAVAPGAATSPADVAMVADHREAENVAGKGTEGEEPVWIGRYSMLKFTGPIAIRVMVSLLYLYSLIRAQQDPEFVFSRFNYVFGLFLGAWWLYLGYQMARAWYSRYYRLTNRRLFVSSGIIHRRRDMMELLRVKDVTMRQSGLLERWIGLGTVIVTSTEKGAPLFLLPGVRNPKEVLDLIWHHARFERDLRSVKVDHV